ncbi:FAD-dependent oxidoreductase [Paracoccus marcusii]|uniref:FAD-dependent oxidoreductase n=1 Tax=Paracoccus marcusii TaxID=59779 RepID=UPI002ED2B5ED|nr:FAD-dependent oxidoreductase [Paracoccus marcusii]
MAAGGRPAPIGIPGEELAMISDDLFLMDRLPGRILLVGGGFIACEFATILAGLGWTRCRPIAATRCCAVSTARRATLRRCS